MGVVLEAAGHSPPPHEQRLTGVGVVSEAVGMGPPPHEQWLAGVGVVSEAVGRGRSRAWVCSRQQGRGFTPPQS